MQRALLSAFVTSFVVAIAIAACSGGSDLPSATDGGATDGNTSGDASAPVDGGAATDANGPGNNDGSLPGATPQTIITMYGGAAAGCQTVPPLTVGDFGDPNAGKPARPVKDGATEDGGAVAVSCKVAPSGSGFDFSATVSYAGTSLQLSGTLGSNGKTTAGKMTLAKAGGATWTNTACTFDPTGSAFMGVATGRYWTMVSCGQSTNATNDKCDIFGQIRFENCAQN